MNDITLLYDIELRRPGCVILQVLAGTTITADQLSMFQADWITELAPGLKVFKVTPEQLAALQHMKATDGSKPRKRKR